MVAVVDVLGGHALVQLAHLADVELGLRVRVRGGCTSSHTYVCSIGRSVVGGAGSQPARQVASVSRWLELAVVW